MEPRVSVVVPAYNEARTIEQTVKSILSIPLVEELIVVNDGSEDHTSYLAAQAGARVIDLQANQGKGAALNRGVQEIRGNIIVLLDGDLGHTASEGEKLIRPIIEGQADMTIAKFPPCGKKSGFGLVKGMARLGIKTMTGLRLEEPLSGQRAMTRQVLDYIQSFQSGYGVEVGLTIGAARGGFRIMEVATEMRHKVTGRDIQGFLHRGKQFNHVAQVLWKVWREQK